MADAALSHADGPPRVRRGSRLIRYDVDSQEYDRYRRPIGIPVLAEMLLRGFNEITSESQNASNVMSPAALRASMGTLRHGLEEMIGASFCCGTGANEVALLRELEIVDRGHGHKLWLFDGSDGMLAHARRRLEALHLFAGAKQLDVVDEDYGLPGLLHWTMGCQFAHHLDHNDRAFPRMRRCFARIRQAMRPGGSFLLVFSTPEQASEARWYLNILSGKVPQEQDPAYLYSREFPPKVTVLEALQEAGFEIAETTILEGPYISDEAHSGNDPSVLFRPDFRKAESVFQIADLHKVTPAFDLELRRLIDSGELKAHRDRSEQIRMQIGVAYAVRARAI